VLGGGARLFLFLFSFCLWVDLTVVGLVSLCRMKEREEWSGPEGEQATKECSKRRACTLGCGFLLEWDKSNV